MTLEEYSKYSIIANNLFNFMNGRINNLNSQCSLYVDMYDLLEGTYAHIRYPNNVIINIGTIIDSWDESWAPDISKEDYVGTVIAWSLAHELHHADQLISMIMYNRQSDYKSRIEADVERASYDWVKYYSNEISSIGGFNVIISDITTDVLESQEVSNYKKASVKEFYYLTIANIVLRDLELFDKLDVFKDNKEKTINSIALAFGNYGTNNGNGADTIVIKDNGEYLSESINEFSNIVYKWAGYFDFYTVHVFVNYSKSHNNKINALIEFGFENRYINPMTFKK